MITEFLKTGHAYQTLVGPRDLEIKLFDTNGKEILLLRLYYYQKHFEIFNRITNNKKIVDYNPSSNMHREARYLLEFAIKSL